MSSSDKIAGVAVAALLVCATAVLDSGSRSTPGPWQRFSLAAVNGRAGESRIDNLPGVIFWAWERREDMRFLDPQRSGVAFLAKTVYLPSPRGKAVTGAAGGVVVRPRLQPLRVAPGTPLIAVARIDHGANGWATPGAAVAAEDRERIASEIAELAAIPDVRGVQIDFDAPASEQAFYAVLLKDVRHKLPPEIPLSITALASWCIGDPWLAQLSAGTIDEAVPMLFRMGPDTASVARFVRSGKEFRVAACQTSFGVSTDEAFSHELLTKPLGGIVGRRDKRIYVFAPRAWTPTDANWILQEWQP